MNLAAQRPKLADFAWLSKQYVRGFRGTRTGGTWGPVWDKSLIIVSLYRNGIGAKDISRFLFGTTKELPAVLNCVKAYGVFEPGRKPPGSISAKVKEPEKFLSREVGNLLSEAFIAEHRAVLRAEKDYAHSAKFLNGKWAYQADRSRAAKPNRKKKVRAFRRLNRILSRSGTYADIVDHLVGCSGRELRAHIERGFKSGWTWDNRGSVWHIDHVIPCAAFNLSNPEEAKACFNYANLQALSRQDNIRKNDLLPNGRRASDISAA